MRSFSLLGHPAGIPIYFNHFPGNRFSIRLAFFVGSMDDGVVGCNGAAHWFEHVPFKGTAGYPGGEKELFGLLERHGGDLNAHTGYSETEYETVVPKKIWEQALDIISDLGGRPLITAEAVEAERRVIHSEIGNARSTLGGFFWQTLPRKFWLGHPIGHPVLGDFESLSEFNTDGVRRAHELLYDRSRAILVVSGDVEPDTLLALASEKLEKIPDHGLTERRGPASYGALPSWQPGYEVLDTSFDASLVLVAWPIPHLPTEQSVYQSHLYTRLKALFNHGSLSSPLLQTLRTECQLVYGASAKCLWPTPDGGIFFVIAQTNSRNKVPAIIGGIHEVVRSEKLCSLSRSQYTIDHFVGNRDMDIEEPHDETSTLLGRILYDGNQPLADDAWYRSLLGIPHQEVVDLAQSLTPDRSRTLVLQGTA